MPKSTAFPFFISGYFHYLGKLLSGFYQMTATTVDDSVISPSPLRTSISRPMNVHHHRPEQPAGDNVLSFYLITSLDFRNSLTSYWRDEGTVVFAQQRLFWQEALYLDSAGNGKGQ